MTYICWVHRVVHAGTAKGSVPYTDISPGTVKLGGFGKICFSGYGIWGSGPYFEGLVRGDLNLFCLEVCLVMRSFINQCLK